MVGEVDPARLVRETLSLNGEHLGIGDRTVLPLEGKHLWLVALGKAAIPMARAAREVLGSRLAGGLVISPQALILGPPLEAVQGEHPQPGPGSLRAGGALVRLCSSLGAGDVLLVLLSGGGSSLAVHPREGIMLEDYQVMNQLLLEAPLSICQVNAVRKALDRLKGGGLARAAYPAQVVQLVISDVVGDDLGTIASGPFIATPPTFAEAWSILQEAGLEDRVPSSVARWLKARAREGAHKNCNDAEKAASVASFIIGSNRSALLAGRLFLQERGFPGLVLSSCMEGELGALVRFHAQVLQEALTGDQPIAPPCAILSGGESFLRVTGSGKGGRNQEFALRFALEMAVHPDTWALLSAGTDGVDGNSPAAGAIVLGGDMERARRSGFDPEGFRRESDSYGFFAKTAGVLQTGPTGTNVADVRVMLAWLGG
jgi:glycerate 2-kinase